MKREERIVKWIIIGMVFFAVACSMLFASVIMRIQSNNKIEPIKIHVGYPPLYIATRSSGPPTWIYYIWLYQDNSEPIKKGATSSIGGDGIISASVIGEALLDEFGAWQVKEVKNNGVIFEATKDANLTRSFDGFSVTAAESTKQIEVNWWFAFAAPEIDGKKVPVSFTQGVAWGPGK